MNNEAFRRALYGLSHPVSIGALIVLLLNDHVWRRVWPSWFTGKIGDFTWLIFAPFLLAAILAWLLPPRLPRRDERVGQLAIVITGLFFGLAKTVPIFHALTIWVLETMTGWPSALRFDPTDLLALPALLIARHIWIQARKRPLPSRGWVLLPLAALATMANQPAVDYGITGLEISGSTIFVTGTEFYSEDGGLSWQGESYGSNAYAERGAWTLPDPSNSRVLYRFTPGVSIERSDDGGLTWLAEVDLRGDEARLAYLRRSGKSYYGSPVGPLDAVIHTPSENIVAAMGHEGVLVRTRDDTWHWVAVGEYSVPELNRADQVISLLSGEIWLSAALIGLDRKS